MPPIPIDPLSKIREAREAIQAQALESIQLYLQNIKEAMAAGEYEVAASSLQWLIEHTPAHNGVTIVDQGIDKPRQIEDKKGPVINIGFALGGVTPKALPEPVIEVTAEPVNE